jgi:hypothetical protein
MFLLQKSLVSNEATLVMTSHTKILYILPVENFVYSGGVIIKYLTKIDNFQLQPVSNDIRATNPILQITANTGQHLLRLYPILELRILKIVME